MHRELARNDIAGPAALTFARLLRCHSIPCRIFERDADRFVRTQGGSLDLHEGSAQLALREAGLYEDFLKHARPEAEVLKIYNPWGVLLLDEQKEESVKRPGEFKGRPEIDRVLLRNLLLNSIEPSSVHWGRKLRSVQTEDSKTYDLHFAEGIEKDLDLVVGADGAWSKVRGMISDQRPFYSGVGGLDLTLTEVDNRLPHISQRVGPGMCLTLGENRGLLAQRNGNGSVRVYMFMRVAEEWYAKHGAQPSDPVQVKKEVLEEFFADWEQDAKDLVLQSDDEVFVRPLYMLPIGFKWEHKPG